MSWWLYPIIAVGTWFAAWFLYGVWLAATGKPIPQKPERK